MVRAISKDIIKYLLLRNRAVVFLIIIFFSCVKIGFSQYDSLLHASFQRTYLLHIPPSYTEGTPIPLVIAMHGGFGSGVNLQNQSGLSLKADEEGFIVVYPEGVVAPITGIRTWNAGGCCGYAMNQNVDDVGFISTLIDTLNSNYSIDTDRVYATGMSNGAFLAYRLACELSDKITAIAPVAGSMNVNSCSPTRSVPVIQFHSKLDSNVPFNGGVGSGVSSHYNPPLDSVLNVWSVNNDCAIHNDTVYSGSDYTHIRWSNCACSDDVHYYLTEDGGHSWPGGQQTVVGDPVSTSINANDLMWTFFQKYTLGCSIATTEKFDDENKAYKIFPNPFSSQTTIQLNESLDDAKLILYNTVGKVIVARDVNTGDSIILDRGDLEKGIYFLRIIQGNETIIFDRVVVND